MAKQALSIYARRRKAERDKKEAMTPRRRAMKAENQRLRRKAKKNGKDLTGLDYDHNRNRFVSVRTNRSATKSTNNTKRK
jgi:hypothetical protein